MPKRPPDLWEPPSVPEERESSAEPAGIFDTIPPDQADPSELLPPELRELAIRTRPDMQVPEGMRDSFSRSFEAVTTGEEEVDGQASDVVVPARVELPSQSSGVFARGGELPDVDTLNLPGTRARRSAFATNVFHEVSTTLVTSVATAPRDVEAAASERTEIVSYVSDDSVPALETTDIVMLKPVPTGELRDTLDGPTDRHHAPRAASPADTALSSSHDTDLWTPDGVTFGRYRLLRHIKAGGMGTVYQAMTRWGAGIERLVAVKRLLLPHTERERFVHMFLDEARIMIRLKHPAIVKVLEFGQVGDEHFLAMEYVHGRDLDSLMKTLREQGRSFPIEIAIYVLRQVLAALEHAHNARDEQDRAAEIVHRDVSPPNILCSFTGQVKLADFGVAKATGKFAVTVPGEIKGKLAYMSPEQLKEARVDRRSDVFAAGIVLHELLSGAPLFLGKAEVETMYKVLEAPIPSLGRLRDDVPQELARIVETALEREPDRRYSTAREMGDALARVASRQAGDGPARQLGTLLDDLYAGEPAGRPLS